MVNPPEYDDDKILEELRNLPERWERTKDNQMKIRITAHPSDAGWISARIYKDVDKGLITANIHARKSEHSVETVITLTLAVNVDVAATITAISALLVAIKHRSIFKWSERQNKKRLKKSRE